ncbi:MAG: glucokinase [Nitrosospira sp.]|nr:glucokinase [Nitrosospira sp.]
MTRYIISGDIGGTKTLLQAARLNEDGAQVLCERRYDSREYPSFSDVLGDFLNTASVPGMDSIPASACFAVAGPVAKQRATLTNLPWLMDGAALAREFSIPAVKLINDFEAVALSVEVLPAADLVELQAGKPYAREMRVALGAGTGMGVAWLTWQGRYIPLPTEAGHMDFAPADDLQARLLQYLRRKFGHVSVERTLSGPGLTNIYNFLMVESESAARPAQALLEENEAPKVTDLAFNQKHSIALKAMDLFVEIYGAYAGNLALAGMCRSGVYVAGGIAPKIVSKLREGGFMKAFREKGRFSALMEEIPVHVVMNSKSGLLGAASEAQRMLIKND